MSETTLEEMKEALPTVAGRVEAVNDRSDKNYYGVRVNDEWFNGENSTEISKGDLVELKVKKNRDSDDVFIDIVETSILEEADQSKDSVSEGSTSSAQSEKESMGDKSASSNNFTSKSRDISIKVALKTAAEHASTRPSDDQGRHLDEVNELANGYLNIMEGLKGGQSV